MSSSDHVQNASARRISQRLRKGLGAKRPAKRTDNLAPDVSDRAPPKRNRGSDAEWAMVKLAGATVGLTLVTAAAAIAASWAAWHQATDPTPGRHADAAAKNAASAAKFAAAAQTQADASKSLAQSTAALAATGGAQLGTARDTASRQLRAYVSVAPSRLTDFRDGTAPQGGAHVTTMGQTPAYDVRSRTYLAALSYPKPDLTAAVRGARPVATTRGILFPNSPMSQFVRSNVAYSGEGFAQLKEGKQARLYVFGSVTYRDSFGVPHFKNFCFSYEPDPSLEGTSEVCPIHNEAD
jgi:hypothetical protein